MPPEKMITRDMMKQILKGEKTLLKMAQVRFINVPAYAEISVKHMYPKLMKLEGMSKYFPDKYAKGN